MSADSKHAEFSSLVRKLSWFSLSSFVLTMCRNNVGDFVSVHHNSIGDNVVGDKVANVHCFHPTKLAITVSLLSLIHI